MTQHAASRSAPNAKGNLSGLTETSRDGGVSLRADAGPPSSARRPVGHGAVRARSVPLPTAPRLCYCGARIRRGRLGLEWVHVERRIGNPHYARPARLSEGRRGFPPNPDAPPSA